MATCSLRTTAQIKQASRVAGLALNSIHKGLHVADDVQNLGEFRAARVTTSVLTLRARKESQVSTWRVFRESVQVTGGSKY